MKRSATEQDVLILHPRINFEREEEKNNSMICKESLGMIIDQ